MPLQMLLQKRFVHPLLALDYQVTGQGTPVKCELCGVYCMISMGIPWVVHHACHALSPPSFFSPMGQPR